MHGYDHPWAGGAGKNLLPMTVSGIKALNTEGTWSGNVYTNRGVTFTVLTDNDDNVIGIKTNGTPTNENIQFNLCSDFKAVSGTTYTISGSPSGMSDSTFRIFPSSQIAFPAGNRLSDDVAANRTRTAAGDEDVIFFINIFNGVNVDNKVFYPQIEIGSQATTFSPYTNICPISGRTGTTVSTRNEDNTETASATISFGTTVYGGQVDFKTGRVRVFGIFKQITWGSLGKTVIGNYTRGSVAIESAADYAVYPPTVGRPQLSNLAPYKAAFAEDSLHFYISTDRIQMFLPNDTDNSTVIQLYYELSTPTELTLTPSQLQMLKGYNSVSGDGVITITALTGDSWS